EEAARGRAGRSGGAARPGDHPRVRRSTGAGLPGARGPGAGRPVARPPPAGHGDRPLRHPAGRQLQLPARRRGRDRLRVLGRRARGPVRGAHHPDVRLRRSARRRLPRAGDLRGPRRRPNPVAGGVGRARRRGPRRHAGQRHAGRHEPELRAARRAPRRPGGPGM
ncbi:MAG: Ligand-binding SRPBCC domain protein family, partial [uncultured Nocardioidaceae bacterium]